TSYPIVVFPSTPRLPWFPSPSPPPGAPHHAHPTPTAPAPGAHTTLPRAGPAPAAPPAPPAPHGTQRTPPRRPPPQAPPAPPTLNGPATVGGNIIAGSALGVVVHDASIGRNVIQHHGGGGFTCEPQGVFALLGPPAYSTYEDSTIGGSIELKGMRGCWLGVIRDQVHHSVRVFNNQMADPDAIEIMSNHIHRNLNCRRNSMVWDSSDITEDLFPRDPHPNTVDGTRKGQCVLPSPT